MKEALGLVEVRGLASAIHVADVMVKAANVHIIGLEKARGSGWMTVKVSGDVGAVQAAVEAGAAEGLALQALISKLVIPRPADGLDKMLKPEPVITPLTKEPVEPEPAKAEEPKAEEPKRIWKNMKHWAKSAKTQHSADSDRQLQTLFSAQ